MKFLLTGETTKRLIFMLVDRSYFDAWLDLFRNPDAARFLGLQNIDTPYSQCREWFNRVEERYMKELEIGYSILPQFRNMGYATESAIKCRDFAFQNDFTGSLISIIHTENIRSEKVALKVGMLKTKSTEFRNMPVNIFRINKT